MLYALRHPVALLVLAAGFVAAVTLHGWVQARLAGFAGERTGRAAGRTRLDPRRHVDPFGAVAAVLGGTGWGAPVTVPMSRPVSRPMSRPTAFTRHRSPGGARLVAILLSGSVLNLAVCAASVACYLMLGGDALSLQAASVSGLLHGDVGRVDAATGVLLFGVANLAVGLLALVPIPPLDGGRLLFAFGPRSRGWQRAEHVLAEQNWGVGALLLLLLLPIAGERPLLLALLDVVGGPLLALAARAGG